VAASLWSEADITTLKAAIASGVMMVSYSGPPSRTVTYQSLNAMRELLGDMVRDVRDPVGFRVAQHNKGFRP